MSTPAQFWVEPEWFDGLAVAGSAVLGGAEGRHAATVRRLKPGEQVRCSDGAGQVAYATVQRSADHELTLQIDAVGSEARPTPRLVLVQALAKGGRDEAAIEAATELGVDTVIPWAAEHCVVQWSGPKAAKGQAKWASVVDAAAKQARRAWRVDVEPVHTSAQLMSRASSGAQRIVPIALDAGALPLAQLAQSEVVRQAEEVWLVVGPEGGISVGELGRFDEAQWLRGGLGPHVLRSSSAGPAACAVMGSHLRW